MLFLQTPAPKVLPPDSVRQATREIVTQLQTDPQAFWHDLLQSVIHFGLKVLMALVIYLIGIWLIRWVKKLLQRMFVRRKTEPTLATFISSAVSISLTVLLIIITIGTLGVDTTSLAALLAAGGMAIGMALSGTVQNFAGGIMLLAFKPFKAGDFISAQDFTGTVAEVNITSTKLITTDNRIIILPNGALSNGPIDNYTGRPLRRIEWKVSVAYGADAALFRQTVYDMLAADTRILNAATDIQAVYAELDPAKYQLGKNYTLPAIPDPFVEFFSLNASDITFVVRAWVRATDYWDVYFLMNQRFYTELPQHGFSFAYPHVVVSAESDEK